MQKLIEKAKKAQSAVYLACEESVADDISSIIGGLLKELSKHQWIPVSERNPEESGEYLCKLIDGRDDHNDEWVSVEKYKVSKAFNTCWELINFEIVTHWTHIPDSQG